MDKPTATERVDRLVRMIPALIPYRSAIVQVILDTEIVERKTWEKLVCSKCREKRAR